MPIPPGRDEPAPAVCGNRLPQPGTAIQQIDLAPQVHQPVRRRRSGKLHDTVYAGADPLQRPEPFRSVVLERGRFIQDDHIKGPAAAVQLSQPGHVLPVDGVQVCRPLQGREALFQRSEDRDDGQVLQFVPLPAFLRPGRFRDTQRGNHQDTLDIEIVIQQGLDGRQGRRGLSHTHIQQKADCRLSDDQVHGVLLIRSQGQVLTHLRFPSSAG